MICRMLHFPGSGTKSNSGPAAPVIATATISAPRRKRSNNSANSLMHSHSFFWGCRAAFNWNQALSS